MRNVQQPNTKQMTTTSAHAPIDKLRTKIDALIVFEVTMQTFKTSALGPETAQSPLPIPSSLSGS